MEVSIHQVKEGIKNLKIDSTFNQRRALFNMYTALKWDVRRIRNMTFDEARDAIKKASEYIDKNGFEREE